MLGNLIGPDIVELIEQKQFAQLREALAAFTPDVVADIFSDMTPHDVAVVLRILPRGLATDIFEYMPLESQEDLLRALGREDVAAVLNEMAPDDRTALLEELPGSITQRLLTLLSPEERRIATMLLGYPEESVGRLMTPDYVAVRPEWTVSEVLNHVRKVGHDKETLNVIYVVDERGRLIDDIRLRELILADPAKRLAEIVDQKFFALRADQDQEEAVREFQRLDRLALPVVDSTGLLVGMVTVDDIMDVAEEEVTEDMHRMAAVAALDAPYLHVGFASMVRKRALWLSILFLGEMATVAVIHNFEGQISRAAVLVFFIPLIISSGGNSGSQAATLVIRALAVRDVGLRDWWRVMYRELGSGLALGCVLGVIAAIPLVVGPLGQKLYGDHSTLVGVTIALSLVGVVMNGTLVGSMLPILLQRVGLDPAVSSTPFVATLLDVSGIVIYFTIATLVLSGTLLAN